MEEDQGSECERKAQTEIAEQDVLVGAANECDEDGELEGAGDEFRSGPERKRREFDEGGGSGVGDLADDPEEREAAQVGVEEAATQPVGQRRGDPRSMRARTT